MYQIRKGWPADAAIDEVVTAAPGAELKEGMVVTIDGNRQATPAVAVTGTCGFLFGKEPLAKTFVALLSDAVIEVDANHYVAGTYTAGDALGVGTDDDAGKFAVIEDADGEGTAAPAAVGRVISFDTNTGIMRLRWFASK